MRRFVFICVVSTLCACKLRDVRDAVAFEGEIEMTVSSTIVAPITTRMEMKGAKIRTETAVFSKVVTITDSDAKKSWMINDAARTYSELDLTPTTTTAPSAPKPPPAKVVKKGSDAVLGKSCDVYDVEDGISHVEVCVASGFSMLAMGLGNPFGAFAKGDGTWDEVLKRGFPLRIVMRDPIGGVMLKMEATRIEKKKIPDSELQVPAGYTKTASPI